MSYLGGPGIPSGVVLDYAGSTAPQGYLLCFGQTVSRTTYAKLYAAISITYGAGDGSTTFAIPDCRGRSVSGKDDMGGTAANRVTNAISGITGTTLGAVGGSQSLQVHQHTATGLGVSGTNVASSVSGSTATASTSADGDHSHAYYFNTPAGLSFSGADARYMLLANNVTPQAAFPTATSSQQGAHAHNIPSHSISGTAVAQSWSGSLSGSVASTGAGVSQNMTPTIIMNKIIRV